MSGSDVSGDWIAKAENDLLNIRNNLSSLEIPWDTICFHAQQAAEKFLKAFLIRKRVLPPRTHDLLTLVTEAAAFDAGLKRLEQDCQALTDFAVAARYPSERGEPGEEDGRAAHAAALR